MGIHKTENVSFAFVGNQETAQAVIIAQSTGLTKYERGIRFVPIFKYPVARPGPAKRIISSGEHYHRSFPKAERWIGG